MPEKCFKCTGPATAGPNPLFPTRSRCVSCAAVTKISIPANLERLADVPDSIADGPAWPIASKTAQGRALWLHQANALQALERGSNIVVATSTASGKTLIFQTWTLHRLKQDPKATALVFYPTKALANDQARRWQECCETLKMDPKTVGQIDGDVKTDDRQGIIGKSRIILATPDICHSWILKESRDPSVRRYLRQLSVLIIDEAHTYESVFGSNSAYLFRRLTAAALNAGAPTPPRIIAATATIQEPAEHLEKLTGRPFTVISDEHNGSPRYVRNLHHLPLDPRGGNAETQMAQLVKSIIDNEPKAQVIAFHDSRQGIERITQAIDAAPPGPAVPVGIPPPGPAGHRNPTAEQHHPRSDRHQRAGARNRHAPPKLRRPDGPPAIEEAVPPEVGTSRTLPARDVHHPGPGPPVHHLRGHAARILRELGRTVPPVPGQRVHQLPAISMPEGRTEKVRPEHPAFSRKRPTGRPALRKR